MVGSARHQERNLCPPPALKEARNESKRQRVQHDEVDAAALTTAYGPSVVVDETHAGFDAVKDTTALTRSTTSGVRLAKRMGRPCLLARGYRGLKLTQTGSIIATTITNSKEVREERR